MATAGAPAGGEVLDSWEDWDGDEGLVEAVAAARLDAQAEEAQQQQRSEDKAEGETDAATAPEAAPAAPQAAASTASAGGGAGEGDNIPELEALLNGEVEMGDEPMLLINWTALTEGRITAPPEPGTEEMAEYVQLVQDIMADFDAASEDMFMEGIAQHTTSKRCEADQAAFRAELPPAEAHYVSLLDYPSEVGGQKVKVLWGIVQRAPQWPCVGALKRVLANASRPVTWKALMCMEVENLAIKQHLTGPAPSQSTAGGAAATTADEANGSAEDGQDTMNVLDQIIAMALDRAPQRVASDPETHYQGLARFHESLRGAWVRQFGGLPPDSLWRTTT